MARFASYFGGNGLGSLTLPCFSIYASATKGFRLLELYVANVSVTPARYKLTRLLDRGTPGASPVEAEYIDARTDPAATVFTAHTVAPTLGGDLCAVPLCSAANIQHPLRFWGPPSLDGEAPGIYVPPGAANGLGVILAAGTGQNTDISCIWEE